MRPSELVAVARQGWTFSAGVRRLLQHSTSLQQAVSARERAYAERDDVFLGSLEVLVWSQPTSPYLPLLDHAGIGPDDLRAMVRRDGVESALEQLRDAGVYISYEEYTGKQPVRRGALEMEVEPASFFNPLLRADYMGSTGGTRSGGMPVALSFEERIQNVGGVQIAYAAYDFPQGAPVAVWLPCLPSAAGQGVVLSLGTGGMAPERWFSQIPTTMEGVPATKRITNVMLPLVGRASGVPLPRPRHVPNDAADTVLDWCIDALRRGGRASIVTYPSSAVRVASLAEARGVRLDGLVVSLIGEPATIGRRGVVERTGARTTASYGFMQMAGGGSSCPHETAETYHVNNGAVAVISRRRSRSDGLEVDAFLWTSLRRKSRAVFINVENDDHGTITRRDEPCTCLFGRVGSHTDVGDVRGLSKVVAGGVTVAGEVLERLVDDVLPTKLGGSPLDYQFVELDMEDRGVLALRVDPRLGTIDEGAVLRVVVEELERNEMGRLASAVWVPGLSIRVIREPAMAARSGKTLPFEPLARSGTKP